MFLKEMQSNPREAQKQMMADCKGVGGVAGWRGCLGVVTVGLLRSSVERCWGVGGCLGVVEGAVRVGGGSGGARWCEYCLAVAITPFCTPFGASNDSLRTRLF